MSPPPPPGTTLLEVFTELASSPESRDLDVVECLGERWSYEDLHCVSSGLALEFAEYCASQTPFTVSVISENHPYVIALAIAVWKLGGILAPIDVNSPPDLQKAMLRNISPSCVVSAEGDERTKYIAGDLGIPWKSFEAKKSTITALTQQFITVGPDAMMNHNIRLPSADDLCLYIHTSSATKADNIKCVPITHKAILSNSRAQIDVNARHWPNKKFENLQVLGWSPFSHLMSYCHDLVPSVLLTRGCYHFAVPPSNYPRSDHKLSIPSDVVHQLYEAIARNAYGFLSAVPWIFKELRLMFLSEKSRVLKETFLGKMKGFKMLVSGGAQLDEETASWAIEHNLALSLAIGMTELSGTRSSIVSRAGCLNGPTGVLFKSPLSMAAGVGWPAEDTIIPGAELFVLDENGSVSHTGELCIKSSLIAHRYLNKPSNDFVIESDGQTLFMTGDVYTRTPDNRFIWRGRKDDYVQLITGETLDPRIVESELCLCSSVSKVAAIGDRLLDGPSHSICLVVELISKDQRERPAALKELTRALGKVNRTLLPPLRIAWSRVLVLDVDEVVPLTRKKTVFRKLVCDWYGPRILALRVNPPPNVDDNLVRSHMVASSLSDKDLDARVIDAVAVSLNMTVDDLMCNSDCTFAELGMNSSEAVAMVKRLNDVFSLDLPPNTCHVFVDLLALSNHIKMLLRGDSFKADTRFSIVSISTEEHNDIVIVGQSMRLPGGLDDSEAVWQALLDRRTDLMSDVPSDRWDHPSFYRPQNSASTRRTGDITFQKAGFIDTSKFDNAFFGISPSEALYISPANRLVLEAAFEALEDANIPTSQVKGSQMGIFVGDMADDGYSSLLFEEKSYEAYSRFYGSGVSSSAACGRLSYLLDVHGPSITVDTACSSGMVALDLAVRDMRSSETETAVVIAVNTNTAPGNFGFLSAQKMSSVNSRCATFSNNADGYVPSEAVVALVLKRMSSAKRDGNNILAVIRSSETRHNGRSQGLVAPSMFAQADLQRTLIHKAKLQPSEIDFVESHGTGTSLGDLIEIQGINSAFLQSHSKENPLVVGAAKSCLGHTEAAAALVGIVKALKTLRSGMVPGLVHLTEETINPSLNCSQVPLHLPVNNYQLRPADVYRGIVLSYGFAGTIAGAILEGYPLNPCPPNRCEISNLLFVVSAKSHTALSDYLAKYVNFCQKSDQQDVRSICYTSCVGREHYNFRFSCVIHSMTELNDLLRARISDPIPPRNGPRRTVVALAFPGQGLHYPGMARNIARFPTFLSILTNASRAAENASMFPVLNYLTELDFVSADAEKHSQLCTFIFQYAVAIWLNELGIQAVATIGHSLGEIAAAVISGVLSFHEALDLVILREHALFSCCPAGMAAVAASADEITDLATTSRADIDVSVYNGPDSHVVSGKAEDLDRLVAEAKRNGYRATSLNVNRGFHSRLVDDALPTLSTWCQQKKSPIFSPLTPFVSSTMGTVFNTSDDIPDNYWVEHARQPVRFDRAVSSLVNHVGRSGCIILDIGPQPSLWTQLQRHDLRGSSTLALMTKKGGDQELAFFMALKSLFEMNVAVDFHKLYLGLENCFVKIHLPTYPFQRVRYWPNAVLSRDRKPPSNTEASIHHLQVDSDLLRLLDDHVIDCRRILPGMALIDFVAQLHPARTIESIKFHMPLAIDDMNALIVLRVEPTGAFTIVHRDGKSEQTVSSGRLGQQALHSRSNRAIDYPPSPPEEIVETEAAYNVFSSTVKFGPRLQNVQSISFWPDRADAVIAIENSGEANVRLRLLDPVLHAFGIVTKLRGLGMPEGMKNGFFLPSTLEGIHFYTDCLPSSFTCRYYLPFAASRSYHVCTIAFDVISGSGELLISCERYSVAYVAQNLALHDHDQASKELPVKPSHLQIQWGLSKTSPSNPNNVVPRGKRHICFGNSQSNLGQVLQKELCPIAFFEVNSLPSDPNSIDGPGGYVKLFESALARQKHISLLIDTTAYDTMETSDLIERGTRILAIMQDLLRQKIEISSFIVLSALSSISLTTTDNIRNGLETGLGAAIQGMIRVFRRETGLGSRVRGVDLPDASQVSTEELQGILQRELHGFVPETFFSRWKRDARTNEFVRVVPILRGISKPDDGPVDIGAVAVIAGMGSIGKAFVFALPVETRNVVYLGRRKEDDEEIVADIVRQQRETGKRIIYRQVDITDLDGLRNVLQRITSDIGPVTTILHSAAVVKDAAIENISSGIFSEVLRPKVVGAWNLHMLSQELQCPLKAFVVLSSVSVSLGNPGQLSYVAGNSFLDWLAAHRQEHCLPGISLQLGAWESRLVDNLAAPMKKDDLIPVTSHGEGTPLILKAVKVGSPVQLISKINVDTLSRIPSLAQDSLFEELIASDAVKGDAKATPTIDVGNVVLDLLQVALELDNAGSIDVSESLISHGIDSISFALFRGQVLDKLGVELPLKFLSDAYSIQEIISAVTV